jgi:carbamoyltransferase
VITYDGADFVNTSSGAFFAMDNVISPLVLPRMWTGTFYNRVAARIFPGCDAGKMMGLAPYGKPTLYIENAIGTGPEKGNRYARYIADAWIDEALARAKALGYDLSPLGDRSAALAAINVDLAASAHQTFEDNVIATVAACKSSFDRIASLRGRPLEGLCFSGGCALSCPTNTRAALTAGFSRVFVDPGCDDSGLSLGGALWAYHNLLDRPLIPRNPEYPMSPYLGLPHSKAAVSVAIEARRGSIKVESPSDAARAAAEDLKANRIVGWFEGRSELGPRALGHRSILSDPRDQENWARVNTVKSRERWRPFAPAVLKEEAHRWFADMPLPSPYMLFTGNVIAPDALPAITHVDGTARVQTVTSECGEFYNVLRSFMSLGGCPVVMNTSLNGPGEPIVETPDDALNFFVKSDLDAIYVDGLRVTKA